MTQQQTPLLKETPINKDDAGNKVVNQEQN